MQVSRIDKIQQFERLRPDWEQVYASDPNAHFYLSWIRLRGWFEIIPYRWFALAVKPDELSPYVAFFPLHIRYLRLNGFNLIRELRMGGKPLGGYTGLVCSPEYEEEAVAALAYHIQQLDWDSFQMEQVLDRRLDLFLEHFSFKKFDIQQVARIASSYIALPDTWEDYLQESLGSKTRRNFRRSLRQVANGEEFKVTQVQADTVERDIDILLTLWQQRWGQSQKAEWHRHILLHFFENNCLWLNILWAGPAPIAALTGVVDFQHKAFYALIIGSNTGKYAKLSPGKVMFGYSIQYAIENGLKVYDLVMGNDSYKSSLGAIRRDDPITMVISRKGFRSIAANLTLNLSRQMRDFLRKR